MWVFRLRMTPGAASQVESFVSGAIFRSLLRSAISRIEENRLSVFNVETFLFTSILGEITLQLAKKV